MDLIQFSYVIVMYFKGGGWVGKVLLPHPILKTQAAPPPPPPFWDVVNDRSLGNYKKRTVKMP